MNECIQIYLGDNFGGDKDPSRQYLAPEEFRNIESLMTRPQLHFGFHAHQTFFSLCWSIIDSSLLCYSVQKIWLLDLPIFLSHKQNRLYNQICLNSNCVIRCLPILGHFASEFLYDSTILTVQHLLTTAAIIQVVFLPLYNLMCNCHNKRKWAFLVSTSCLLAVATLKCEWKKRFYFKK